MGLQGLPSLRASRISLKPDIITLALRSKFIQQRRQHIIGDVKFELLHSFPTAFGRKSMNQKIRRGPRYPFIAVAEIAHTESGGKFSCRVSELSLNGCYVDMLNTLPIGSEVATKIFTESECFEAKGKVIYAHPNLGMGLAFEQVSLKSQTLLRQWLLKASGGPECL
jgi:PilZ domain